MAQWPNTFLIMPLRPLVTRIGNVLQSEEPYSTPLGVFSFLRPRPINCHNNPRVHRPAVCSSLSEGGLDKVVTGFTAGFSPSFPKVHC